MEKRHQIQQELIQVAIEKRVGIIKASMRVGKTRVGVSILEKIGKDAKILITYPDNQIRQSWLDEFEKMSFCHENVTLSSNRSLHKHENKVWDAIIVDEVHKLSERNIESVKN